MQKKHILIGVSGSIAAYKACDLVSSLVKQDYQVKVIMTQSATQFVSPLTLETLSNHSVLTNCFDSNNEDPIAHISLAKWADLFVLAPASANVIAKVVHGIADDSLTSTFLAATCKKIICPAMNVHMYENPITQHNLNIARSLGYEVVEPATGLLACHDVGKGKLANLSTIEQAISNSFVEKKLEGKNILVSAGPTQEALDPVRFITNHSSGKQGYAIAQAAQAMGANVKLVSGPVSLEKPEGIEVIDIISAQDLYEAMTNNQDWADYIIMSAAVADYKPETKENEKIKKSDDTLNVSFVRNPDILLTLGQNKKDGQLICGFAMETNNLDIHAKEKLEKKNCDLLIGNHLFTQGAGFKGDTNVVSVVTKEKLEHWPQCTKKELGFKILDSMIQLEKEKQ